MVAYGLDKQGRLVGQIEQLAETIDPQELALYVIDRVILVHA
jgi:hypothetical protein